MSLVDRSESLLDIPMVVAVSLMRTPKNAEALQVLPQQIRVRMQKPGTNLATQVQARDPAEKR